MHISNTRTLAMVVVVFVFLVSFLAVEHVRAQQADRVVEQESDLMTAGRTVNVQTDIDGDVAAAGSDVTVTAPVSGYVMSAGRHVTLSSEIGNDLWAAGETVDVTSEIGNNIMAAGRTVHLHPGTTVGQDARLVGNEVTTEGRIVRDLRIGAATARIAGDVGGSVRVDANRVFVQPGTVIDGDLVVRASQPPDVAPDAKIGGTIHFENARNGSGWWAGAWFWVLCFVGFLILGLVVMTFAPRWTGRVASTIQARPVASLLVGLVVLIVTPIVIAGLAISIVGVPLALLLLAAYGIALLMAFVLASYRTGNWLFARMHRSAPQWVVMGLGVLAVSIGLFLPFVGWLVALIVLMVGMGALTLDRWNVRAGTPHTSIG